MLVAAEDPCPSVLPAPYQLGEDISPNGVVCANFKYGFPILATFSCDLASCALELSKRPSLNGQGSSLRVHID